MDMDIMARDRWIWNPPVALKLRMVRLYLSDNVYSVFFFFGRKRVKAAEIPVWHKNGHLNFIETRVWNHAEEGGL